MKKSVHRSPVAGANNGEPGWSCRTYSWTYTAPKVITSMKLGPDGTMKFTTTPAEWIPSKKYRMGSRWSHVRDTARDLYGLSKGQLLEQIGFNSKITYTY